MVLKVHFARSGIGMDESHMAQFAAAFAELEDDEWEAAIGTRRSGRAAYA